MSTPDQGRLSRGIRSRLTIAALLGLLALVVVILFGLARMPWYPAMPEALAALEPAPGLDVYQSEEGWWVFMPDGSDPKGHMIFVGGELSAYGGGLIFYPGGRIDPRAYAPLARAIAETGHPVVIVPMPLGLAVLGTGRASSVIEAFPKVHRWALGGHSLGGSMAARFAARHPDDVLGVVLLAAWPPDGGLREAGLPTLVIGATEDGLAGIEELRGYADRLPEDTRWHRIEGGNHAQFGWYGPQAGDGQAQIERAEQQDRLGATIRSQLSEWIVTNS